MNLITSILLLAIYSYCMNLTYSADRKNDGSGSWTPKRELMKRFLGTGKNKEVETTRDEEHGKKSRMGSSSSSRGTTSKGKEVQDEPEGRETTHEMGLINLRTHPKSKFTHDQLMMILRLMYKTEHDYILGLGHLNWDVIYSRWRAIYGNISNQTKVKSRGHLLLRKILQEFKHEDEGIDWTDIRNRNLLKIYFETEHGDKSSHDERMVAMWHMIYPGIPIPRPGYLCERAEYMLGLRRKQDNFNDPWSGLTTQIGHGATPNWKSNPDEILRYLWYSYKKKKHGLKVDYIYDNAKKTFKEFTEFTPTQVYQRAKYLTRTPRREYIMMGNTFPEANPIAEQGTSSHHPGGTESSIRNPESSHGQPDLELRLGSLYYHSQTPDRIHQHPERESHNSNSN